MLSLLPFFLHRLDDFFVKPVQVLEFTDALCTVKGFLLVMSPTPENISRTKYVKEDKAQKGRNSIN